MSGGVGLLDYDGDGWLDVYLVQGGPFPPPGPGSPTAGMSTDPRPGPLPAIDCSATGGRTFEDASDASGIARLAQGYGHGVAIGD